MYYRRCPICGAYLDPGEHCDCQQVKEEPDKSETVKLDVKGRKDRRIKWTS